MLFGGRTLIQVPVKPTRLAHVWRVVAKVCGFVFAVCGIFALGECYLQIAPPGDLAEHLGVESPKTGPFKPDSRYGAQYRSLAALDADNPGKLDAYRHLFRNPKPPRVWAFFGSSFAQAPGMLADTTRWHVSTRTTFNLGKNEILPVRLAQAELLLDEGLPVERIFIVVIPLDGFFFALHSLEQIRVTPNGGISYDPRLPAVGGWFVRNSRLALQSWTQTGWQVNQPNYPTRQLNDRYDGRMLADFTTAFGHFAKATARHRVPVTMVLLPNHEQTTRGAGFAFQNAITPVLREQGYDVCDVREAFLAYPDKPSLFIPDKHFSDVGNRLLLATVLEHLKATSPSETDLPDPKTVRP
ncbi:MAG: hypothetical protein K8U57_34330 [Planctomycetes bacterium]|nr:hypothetical protein [Planctomycetota bacterium]